MTYEKLLEAVEADDEAPLQQYAKESVIQPCLNGAPNTELNEQVNDYVDVDDDFYKPDRVSVKRYVVVRSSEHVYLVHAQGSYVDTLSVDSPGIFSKCRVDVVVQSEISPNASVHEGMAFVIPTKSI